ncbi:helix-turn-helix transcriptional regulator [Falsirhodobacter sp. 20TX0035]|uniref:helix-turn-helix transcriptional regulator n=1 Tax=Falsirhodobacter sp. 20TX0035 TaxID=3022019 RepID=UPI00232D1BF3|nr:helix-turn-helix domain-containing protein [Falsirhodobacter sp. 20TX0035]MDB6455083.1 helix-turn-helix domain-containing protein [Falsirhodobacter sp. 20TX0035]
MMNLYLNVTQVALRFNVSTDTVYRWIRKETFPRGVRLPSGARRWLLSDIETWENEALVVGLMTQLGLPHGWPDEAAA